LAPQRAQTTRTSVDLVVRGPTEPIRDLVSLEVGRPWQGAWIVESRLAEWVPLHRHVDEVLEQVRPVWADVKRAAALGRASVCVGLWVGSGAQPEWKLTALQMVELADLSAEFEVTIREWEPDDD
jgi:hypothetical protein